MKTFATDREIRPYWDQTYQYNSECWDFETIKVKLCNQDIVKTSLCPNTVPILYVPLKKNVGMHAFCVVCYKTDRKCLQCNFSRTVSINPKLDQFEGTQS